MPAFIPVIAAGIAAGATVYGAKSVSGAQKDASRIEAGSTDKALAAEQENQRYEREQTTYKNQQDEQQRTYDRQQDEYRQRQDAERIARDQEQLRFSNASTSARDKIATDTFGRQQEDRQRYTQQYGDFMQALSPYLRNGTTPGNRVNEILAGRGSTPQAMAQRAGQPAPMGQPAPQSGGINTVMIESPSGDPRFPVTRRAVPQDQVRHYLQQGARLV